MAGPGEDITAGAAGRGYVRASHADREQAIDLLKAAFVQERLTREEFDLRVGRALASRTYADLAAATVGIPAGLTMAQPQTVRKPADKDAVTAVACVSAAWMSIWVPLVIVDGMRSVASFVLAVVLILVVPVSLAGFLMFHAWLDKRAGGPSSFSQRRPPGAGGRRASPRRAPANPARQLPRADRVARRGPEAARIRRPAPSWRPPPRMLAVGL
ncbi:MAG: DUF1707 domain-containing protein [Actinobacteria bacterium]|nr:DUF1707 domain-containing protein [Actinomycetota bacterium]